MDSKPSEGTLDPREGEVVQLRFTDDDDELRDIDAGSLADSLHGLVTFASELSRAGAFGDGPPPDVRVRPIKEGSVVVEAVIQWMVSNPEYVATTAFGAGGWAFVRAFNFGVERLREAPVDYEYISEDRVKVTMRSGRVHEVSKPVWEVMNKPSRKIRKAMAQVQAPLGADAARMEMRAAPVDARTEQTMSVEPDVVTDRRDYRTAAAADVGEEDFVRTFDAEAQLTQIDFEDPTRWKVAAGGRTKIVSIEDPEFLRKVEAATPFAKGDLFDVTIRENRTVREGMRDKIDWTLVRVERKRRRSGDDDHGAGE